MLELLIDGLVTGTSFYELQGSVAIVQYQDREVQWQKTDLPGFDYQEFIIPPVPHVLNVEERRALERALWRSVEIVDNGFE